MKILQYHISNFECYKIIQHHIENFVWYNGDPQYFFHKKYVLILWHLILRLRLSRPSRTMPMISPMPLWSSPCKSCLIDKYPPLLECDGTLMFSGTNFFLLPIPVPTKKKRNSWEFFYTGAKFAGNFPLPHTCTKKFWYYRYFFLGPNFFRYQIRYFFPKPNF